MNGNKRRSREEIVEHILGLCREPVSITRIVYMNNLNFKDANFYVNLLLKADLLETLEGNKIMYKATPKGRDFLARARALRDIIEPFL